jgi:hypothetical protein
VLSALTIFEDCSVAVPEYPELFLQSAQSSAIASLCHTLNLWPTALSQAWNHTTLWELARQDITMKLIDYIFCKFSFLGKLLTINTRCSKVNLISV